MMGIAALTLHIVPFRCIAALLGRQAGAVSLRPDARPADIDRALHIRRTIALAAKYAPFRADCLPQAIVSVMLCRLLSVPYAAHFGCQIGSAATGDAAMTAHAWVVCGPVAISGGNHSFSRYRTVACWVPPGAAMSAAGNDVASDR